MRVRYWCGDTCMRGVVLPRLFRANGFEVLAPPLRGCSPGRLQFPHWRVADFLAERGCGELAEVNRRYGVKERARGDVDFAAGRGSVVLVGEVKTRLIVKYAGHAYLRDMLVYHLSEPGEALGAWERLERLGVVNSEYDNPASIAELVRSAAGFYLSRRDVFRGVERVVVAAITVCYARPLLDVMLGSVEAASRYLSRCIGLEFEPAVLMLKPDPSVFEGRGLERVDAECFGGGCSALGGLKGVANPLAGCEDYCSPCIHRNRDREIRCGYIGRCRSLCA